MTDYEKGPELPPEYRDRVDLSVLILRTGTPEAFTVHPSAVERAAEVLARHWDWHVTANTGEAFCQCDARVAQDWDDPDSGHATHQADALAAAGLLWDAPADGVQAWPQEDA